MTHEEANAQQLFRRGIVKRTPLDNGISDEVELDCGHTIICIVPLGVGVPVFCSECLHSFIAREREGKTLEKIIYSNDRQLPLKLYIYAYEGGTKHGGGVWVRHTPKYPDEEITTPEALLAAGRAQAKGEEIRVCNGSDFCVFHSRNGQVIYPPEGFDMFWESLLRQ